MRETAGRTIPRWLELTEIRPPTDREHLLFQRLIYRLSGIFLSPSKKGLLFARLRSRLQELGIRSFCGYYRRVKDDPEEQVRMLDCICTHETRFFRESRQLELLERRVLRTLKADSRRRSRGLRVWSAGCSTGEEPYSLAMILLDHLPGWHVEILATDLSTRALARARAGVWAIERSAEVPRAYRERYLLRGTRQQQGKMKVGPEVRSIVRFERFNLGGDELRSPELFDLIFCRNVLIYFDGESRHRALQRLLERLAPDGTLFLGHAESLSGMTRWVRGIGPNTYVHAAPGGWEPGATDSRNGRSGYERDRRPERRPA